MPSTQVNDTLDPFSDPSDPDATPVSVGSLPAAAAPPVPALVARFQRPDQFEQVLDWVSAGALRHEVARRLQVPLNDWMRWLRLYATAEQRSRLATAARHGAMGFAEETIHLADTAMGQDQDEISVTRLRISTRQWLAERLNREALGPASAASSQTNNVQINVGQLHLDALLAFAPSVQDDIRARALREATTQVATITTPAAPPVPTLLTPPAADLHALL